VLPFAYHLSSHHITSSHISSHHITSHHISSYHILSFHITSHLISPYHLLNLTSILLLLTGFIGEGKSALTDEEITVLVSCADKDGNGKTLSLTFLPHKVTSNVSFSNSLLPTFQLFSLTCFFHFLFLLLILGV
jgi:hypothetical protein